MEPRENTEQNEIEIKFQELVDKAKEVYPDLNGTISLFKTFNSSNEELNEYINLINQTPPQISTNQFSLY